MQKIKLWFGVCRPYSLFISASPVLAGLLVLGNVPNILVAVATLLCAMSLQVFSNLVNDYYDFVRGCDKAGRSGPQRPLAEGIVNERQMRTACIVALSAIPRYASEKRVAVYSHAKRADIVCFLFYGPVASAGTVYLQVAEFSLAAFYAGCACGCIAVCVLASNNIRDIEDDRAVGKRTFPVRFGRIAALVGVATILLASVAFAVLGFGTLWLLFLLLPDLVLYVLLVKAEGKKYNKCLFRFVLLDVVYVVAFSASLLL